MKLLHQVELPPKELTERQRKALKYLVTHFAMTGEKASLRELADHMGYRSLTMSVEMIEALKKKKVLVNNDNGKGWRLPFAKHPMEEMVEDLLRAIDTGDEALVEYVRGKYEAILKSRHQVDRL